jgi:large subunit ribosomal protein L15
MATRLRKTRKLRGGRHMGWGQVAQHRSSGHKGGLGRSGHLKHLWSTVIKEDQDHFGHESTHRPASVSIITKKWVNVRDLDDLFAKVGKSENSKNILDLTSLEIDKLLGGGKITNAYTIKVKYASNSAQEKVKQAGGEVTLPVQKTQEIKTEVSTEEAKIKDVEKNDG